jgi:DNA polymerase I-like protein with 3'-5' exonuclease and polymerase domains
MLALRQMDDRVSVTRDWFDQYFFHLIPSVDSLRNLVDTCIKRGLCALDCETTGVDNRIYPDEYFEDGVQTKHGIRTIDRVVGLCISFDGQNGYYIPLSHEPEDSGNLPWDETWDEITRLVNNCKVIYHNAKFDCEFIYPLTGKEYWKLAEYEDTYLMAKVINPLKSYPGGLKPLTKMHFGIDMVELDELFTEEKKEQLKRNKQKFNFALLHPKEGLEYGCSDGIFTYKIYSALREKLSGNDESIYNIEKSFCNVIRKMERNRVHIDVDRVQQLYVECKAAMQRVSDLIRRKIESKTGNTEKWARLNVGSPSQLSKALFTDPEGMRLKPIPEMLGGEADFSDDGDNDSSQDDKSKQYSLKDSIVKALHKYYGQNLIIEDKTKKFSLFELILEYRHYDKMKGSYVEKMFISHDKYGDVRPSFTQIGTDTTRLASKAGEIGNGYSGVNFMGIPRDSDEDKPELFKQIRTCIAPRPGWMMVKIDYSGEELRVITNMSGDPIWTDSFLNGDGDVHSITSRTFFQKKVISKDERNRGKRSNFAVVYGGGAGAIASNVGCSLEDGQRHLNNLRHDLPVLMGYVDDRKKFARRHKCIYTAFGRRIPLPTIDSPIRMIRAKAERCAINYTIQSTSADVLKLAMCNIDKQIRKFDWEDRVRYVLTVHDEIVFEVKPDHLMEVVPKLDEWMTAPWKIPKVHGRQWIVPLETEPGIDIHWRARFDFFKMVYGSPVDPKLIDETGKYTGNIKDGYYYLNGRIYQEVPDFLESFIHRMDQSSLDQPQLEGPEDSQPLKENNLLETKDNSPALLLDTTPSTTDSNTKTQENTTLSSSDVVVANVVGNTTSQEKQENTKNDDQIKTIAQVSEKPNGILRWTFKGTSSQHALRKLHAVCILTEGNSLLRIINQKGEVIVSESEGIRVNSEQFIFLAGLFGLG